MPGTGLTAISPPFDLAIPLRDLAAAGGLSVLPSIFLCVCLIRPVND